MTTNKKKILITQTMAACGGEILNARDDIDLVEFPNLISAPDFEALLKRHAPVHGVALGATRFGETELEAAREGELRAERLTHYRKVAEQIVQDRPLIYLYHGKLLYAATVKLSGFIPYPDGLIRPRGLQLD